VLEKIQVGGESNRSLAKIWLKSREDYLALRRNRSAAAWARWLGRI
jgi:hypothetical protein